MVISTAKMKSIIIAAALVRSKLVVDDEILEQIMEVGYLRLIITSYGSIGKELNCQISEVNRTPGCTNEITWNNSFPSLEIITRITCEAELRPITARTRR